MDNENFPRGSSRQPSKKQTEAYERRKKAYRGIRKSAMHATEQVQRLVPDRRSAVVLRESFTYLQDPIRDSGVSDRAAPIRKLRPPATRLITSRGVALRFMLTALAFAQQRERKVRDLPIESRIASDTGWTDLIASPAVNSTAGAGYLEKAKTKRRHQVVRALENLERAGLVQLGQGSKRFKDFELLDEGGNIGRAGQDLLPYRKPSAEKEPVFWLPEGFFANGWIHVLQDSEIALVLMLKCGKGSLSLGPGVVAIDSEVRLHRYGFGRDSFSGALRPLEEFGLLQISRPSRNPDGTHEGHKTGEKAPLYRLTLLQEGFEKRALDVGDKLYSR